MMKAVSNTVLPLFTVIAVVVGVLYLLKALPSMVQGGAPIAKEFNTVAEAEAELGFALFLPAYFPERVAWPPSTIHGQGAPVPYASLTFDAVDGSQDALVICQTLSIEVNNTPCDRDFGLVLRRERVLIKGEHGELLELRSPNDITYYQLTWHLAERTFVVTTPYSENDLLRIAESLRR